MREEYLFIVKEYQNRLEPLMQQMENGGLWLMLERTVVADYAYGKNGIVFVFRVK